ncbi:MarR family transcriptional regulator [Hyphomicrobium sp.]|jgi:DNA-binding MarR family transcriptional regulator|uniref:MarR family winged helix-turn-helix transcriptional regulator n=1 Tax=Hyphomicrobium sp. TaxID=82 RepID=UPI002C5D972C|nr:MarR family transcriptional regulator [Hyphomicrobium sp.]HVZ03542.1 MarR family transcriptional regulator [Hyphomicrobium sp.]
MADITSEGAPGRRTEAHNHAGSSATPDDGRRPIPPDLISVVELFYFAYRDFTCDPDVMLEQYGFGRAHHRVLHFVHRNPGLKVAELLDILKITKQSLARVLKQLVDEGFVIQRAGSEDRRERRLYLSAKGGRLTDKLTQIQVKRIEGALAALGPGADVVARNFLFAMITEKDRPQVEILIKGQHAENAAGPDANE